MRYLFKIYVCYSFCEKKTSGFGADWKSRSTMSFYLKKTFCACMTNILVRFMERSMVQNFAVVFVSFNWDWGTRSGYNFWNLKIKLFVRSKFVRKVFLSNRNGSLMGDKSPSILQFLRRSTFSIFKFPHFLGRIISIERSLCWMGNQFN